MQELEKILEEIEEGTHTFDLFGRDVDFVAIDWVRDIIRNHMNDGWISVEERMPEDEERYAYDDEVTRYMKRLEIAYMTDTIEYVHGYYDGYKWMDKYHDTIKNVVAWRTHEPYRPERSNNHDGE